MKLSSKHNHHSSTLTLLSHHNASYASNASLLPESKSMIQKKGRVNKNRESSINTKERELKDVVIKEK
jgi:hypothetical protein